MGGTFMVTPGRHLASLRYATAYDHKIIDKTIYIFSFVVGIKP